MTRIQIAWLLWGVGMVLVLLSWIDVVSVTVGWCGFGIGAVGYVMGRTIPRPHTDPQLGASVVASKQPSSTVVGKRDP